MTDPPPYPTGEGPKVDQDAAAGLPRWVKVSGIIFGVLVVLLIVLGLTGLLGGHGPWQHGP
jgi:hypothetical protein